MRELWGDCRAAVPDVVRLHAMLEESDRNCDRGAPGSAPRRVSDGAPASGPRKLAREAESLEDPYLVGSANSTGHTRGDLVLNCAGAAARREPALRALAKLRALTLAGLPDATARPPNV